MALPAPPSRCLPFFFEKGLDAQSTAKENRPQTVLCELTERVFQVAV